MATIRGILKRMHSAAARARTSGRRGQAARPTFPAGLRCYWLPIIKIATVIAMYCLTRPALSAEPANAVAATQTNGFRLKPGFRIELVASEPMIAAPVAIAFDENGRLFVVEMHAVAGTRGGNQGRVRMLENLNDDGVFQNSTIYAEGLSWPSAVACYAGGIFVAAAPEVLYLKDTKGDGIADARQVVLSGFGGTNNNLSPNFLPNNFNWGPDNRIH
ncbi:MAG TPA: hypothetical protein VL793_12090, partial [Patescibacteria group bacterium]|nr:hypothetical protein [Patescibacteria group bacterium]